ncbi:MAG: hypothetical protein RBU45_11385 [Myxococcota bacterium]|nr:hypothetical protein [Myxococcota bacterium]
MSPCPHPDPAPAPTSLPPRCGAPGWLVRLPQAETRAVTPSYGEAAGGH